MVSEILTKSTSARIETPAPSPRKSPQVAGIGRVTVRAAVIGFLAIVVIVTGGALVADERVTSAIGIAIFAAGWVGLAVGAMFGASLYADRIRDADEESPVREQPADRYGGGDSHMVWVDSIAKED